jgi:hypothetical protein
MGAGADSEAHWAGGKNGRSPEMVKTGMGKTPKDVKIL